MSDETAPTPEEMAEYMTFLDELRESGTVNMSGAARDLRDEYGMSKTESRAIMSRWRETFAERNPL